MRLVVACIGWLLLGCGAGPEADEPCRDDADTLVCPHHTLAVEGDIFGRAVHFKAPPGKAAPPGGWPVVVLFQGSFLPAEWMWHAGKDDLFGGRHQTETVRALLEAGFLVVTPETHVKGAGYWDTNVPPFSTHWSWAPDDGFMQEIFAALEGGRLGPVNPSRWYAAGMSSGGYMTSRMAVSYPGRFCALAIHSASYATCGGPLCEVPAELPAGHPPTLFLHGEKDAVVPIATMRSYRDALTAAKVEVAEIIDAGAGHAWLAAAPEAVRDFFVRHDAR